MNGLSFHLGMHQMGKGLHLDDEGTGFILVDIYLMQFFRLLKFKESIQFFFFFKERE